MSDHREDHADRHGAGGPDELNVDLNANARVGVRKNSGGSVIKRRRINTIEGTAILLTLADDSVNEEADLTVAVDTATMAGAGLAASGAVLSVNATAPLGITSDAVALNSGYRPTFAGTSAPSSPVEGDLWFDTDDNLLKLYNGSVWITITPKAAADTDDGTRSSASYGDLTDSNVGPAVTIDTGTMAIVTISSWADVSVAFTASLVGFAVSGASTVAASDNQAIQYYDTAGYTAMRMGTTELVTGLTAGSNTFTMKYRTDSGVAQTFSRRAITVTPLPT